MKYLEYVDRLYIYYMLDYDDPAREFMLPFTIYILRLACIHNIYMFTYTHICTLFIVFLLLRTQRIIKSNAHGM